MLGFEHEAHEEWTDGQFGKNGDVIMKTGAGQQQLSNNVIIMLSWRWMRSLQIA